MRSTNLQYKHTHNHTNTHTHTHTPHSEHNLKMADSCGALSLLTHMAPILHRLGLTVHICRAWKPSHSNLVEDSEIHKGRMEAQLYGVRNGFAQCSTRFISSFLEEPPKSFMRPHYHSSWDYDWPVPILIPHNLQVTLRVRFWKCPGCSTLYPISSFRPHSTAKR